MEVRKQMLVAWPADAMFDLIEAAEHYPDFLPWCAGARILERDDAHVVALIKVNYHGVHFEFTTRNPKRRPLWMGVTLEHGPFRRFDGEWRLAPLGDAGCRIEFRLDYEFASTLMTKVAGPVFERIADRLVDALVVHADRVLPARVAAAQAAPPAAARHSAAGIPEGANDG
jgi:ribosome-associated toxin RatA of RatAB toxin-antitoxin module